MKRFIFMLVVGAAALAVLAVEPYELDYTSQVDFSISDAGDTAWATAFTPSYGVDSFAYKDSIRFPYDTTLWDTFTWTSPPQQMRVDVGYDTAITYQCSIDLGTNAYGFSYDPSDNDDSTLAVLIDTLVYLFNNTTSMKDTVLAEDSVTYIKLVSKIAQIQLDGDARWTVGLPGDSLDTTTIWVTSVADVCDSMVVYFNALDSARFWIATDEDTAYLVTGNKNTSGYYFFAVNTDTAQDTANRVSDTIFSESIDSGTVVMTGALGYGVIKGRATLVYADAATWGMGVDSCILHLYSGASFGMRNLVVVETCASVAACTLDWAIMGDLADTIIDSDLQLWWWITDTTTDTTLDVTFNLHRHLFMEP